jgi:hypothetical protein
MRNCARGAIARAVATSVVFGGVASSVARATNYSWAVTGQVNGNFSAAGNWNPAGVPGVADYAIVQRLNGRITLDVSPTTSLGFSATSRSAPAA